MSKATIDTWMCYDPIEGHILDKYGKALAIIQRYGRSTDEIKAYTNLIVAAPNLYNELYQHCARNKAAGGCAGRLCQDCSTAAALAKAEGKNA